MKKYKYTLVLLSLITLGSCSKDLGNYEYNDINELTISGVSPAYALLSGFDTLRITPTINATMDEADPTRYQYSWISFIHGGIYGRCKSCLCAAQRV